MRDLPSEILVEGLYLDERYAVMRYAVMHCQEVEDLVDLDSMLLCLRGLRRGDVTMSGTLWR